MIAMLTVLILIFKWLVRVLCVSLKELLPITKELRDFFRPPVLTDGLSILEKIGEQISPFVSKMK